MNINIQNKIFAHDEIYYTWVPRKTEKGWAWMQYIRDVLVSMDGEYYWVLKREKYRYTKYRFWKI